MRLSSLWMRRARPGAPCFGLTGGARGIDTAASALAHAVPALPTLPRPVELGWFFSAAGVGNFCFGGP